MNIKKSKDIRTMLSIEAKEYKTSTGIVAIYLLECPNVSDQTIKKIAEYCEVTTPTPTRLAQKMGLSGFSELKVKLEEENLSISRDATKTTNVTLDTHMKDIISEFKQIYKTLDIKKISRFADKISKSNKIVFYGEGYHTFYLQEFTHKLRKIGINAICPIELNSKLYEVQNSTKDDLIIIISHSASKKYVTKIIDYSLNNKIPILLITSNSTYHKLSDKNILKLDTKSTTVLTNNTRLVTISILDIIFSKIVNKDFDNNLKKLERKKL